MEVWQAIVLALIQGITEFLPISSSAHLLLPKELLAWPDQGLAFDVAVHIGSLAAVVYYFRRDIRSLVIAWFLSLMNQKQSTDGKLAWSIVVATIPAGLAGLLLGGLVEEHLRSIKVIAATTVVFAFLLWWADARCESRKQLTEMTLTLALLLGLAQAIALIPGTSRSGITITAALLLGFGRGDAARFSFLMAIPVILLSGAYMSLKLTSEQIDVSRLAIGIVVSALSAYLCIHYFLSFIHRIGMLPFVVYRLILGAILCVMIFI